MGQSASLNICTKTNCDPHHRKYLEHSDKPRKLSSVTHKEVTKCVQELNTVTSDFSDRTGKQLRFIIRKGTDKSIFWKSTIRIYCQRLSGSNKVIESSLQLSLRQFLKLHQEIVGQISALSKKYEEFMTSAKQAQRSTKRMSLKTPKKNEMSLQGKVKDCCVCKERKGCLMLSCDHEFCEICIDTWIRDDDNGNCPLCQSLLLEETNTVAQPDTNFKSEVKAYLMRLAERTSKPVQQSKRDT